MRQGRPNSLTGVMQEKTNYKSILYKTYFVMEYAVAHYDVRFVLKTDDDAFINVQPLMQQLRLICEDPNCRNERVYMVRPGTQAKQTTVLYPSGALAAQCYELRLWIQWVIAEMQNEQDIYSSFLKCRLSNVKVEGCCGIRFERTLCRAKWQRRARCCCSRDTSGTTLCSTTTRGSKCTPTT